MVGAALMPPPLRGRREGPDEVSVQFLRISRSPLVVLTSMLNMTLSP